MGWWPSREFMEQGVGVHPLPAALPPMAAAAALVRNLVGTWEGRASKTSPVSTRTTPPRDANRSSQSGRRPRGRHHLAAPLLGGLPMPHGHIANG
jgi:hypothetical protein